MNSFERTANACFSNATESINLMAELSGWTPHSFLISSFFFLLLLFFKKN